jgi:choline dehydrogenase
VPKRTCLVLKAFGMRGVWAVEVSLQLQSHPSPSQSVIPSRRVQNSTMQRLTSLTSLARRIIPPLSSTTRSTPLQTSYDYIIIGAGSAGCIMANELSASGEHSVLLLEAGGWDWRPLHHVPAGVYSVFKDPGVNWNYTSEPEPSAGNRQVELPRGKVIGGSSAINAMVYMRGHPKDYDRWCEQHHLSEWSWQHVLPYFKKCETSDRGVSEHRGGEGRLQVTQGNMENPLYETLLKAGESSGQGVSDDLNGYKPEGIARLDRTASPDGRRCSSADAHLYPALDRPNLELVMNMEVEKINLQGKQAVGVKLNSKEEGINIQASKSVVLCAGAIKSPQLLMLSGIGPKEHLNSVGIDCQHHLKGVGENLQDHACVVTSYHSTKATVHHSLSHLSKPLNKLMTGAQWLLDGTGAAASNIWEGGGLVYGEQYQTEKESNDTLLNAPNLQYHFCPVLSEYQGEELTLKPGFQMQIDQLRPFSRGAVTLRSQNYQDAPKATFNYFQDPRDVHELADGLTKATEILHQPVFDKYRGEASLSFDPRTAPRSEVQEWIRMNSGTDYHPCGTCKMSGLNDEDDAYAVVDSELKVRGIDGLRVVDASIMPNIVSGNLNAPVQMIAMKAADMMLGKELLVEKKLPAYHFD